MENFCGAIYILTNPSFPDYVKIGYSKNVEERLNRLNDSEAVPFAFRLYATYDVETQLADKILHKIIDKLNADLRSVDNINDKKRVREFYLISPEDAYELLEDIALISGTKERLHLYRPTQEEIIEEKIAEKNRELVKNRHHFKDTATIKIEVRVWKNKLNYLMMPIYFLKNLKIKSLCLIH